MDIEIVRQLDAGKGMCELLLRVDEEYMDTYRKETGEKDFNQESFDQWMIARMERLVEGEEWRLED